MNAGTARPSRAEIPEGARILGTRDYPDDAKQLYEQCQARLSRMPRQTREGWKVAEPVWTLTTAGPAFAVFLVPISKDE